MRGRQGCVMGDSVTLAPWWKRHGVKSKKTSSTKQVFFFGTWAIIRSQKSYFGKITLSPSHPFRRTLYNPHSQQLHFSTEIHDDGGYGNQKEACQGTTTKTKGETS